MKIYICDHCGARTKEEKPEKCPLCSERDFSEVDEEVTSTDEKERQLVEAALHELDAYTEDCEPYDPRYYNNGE